MFHICRDEIIISKIISLVWATIEDTRYEYSLKTKIYSFDFRNFKNSHYRNILALI